MIRTILHVLGTSDIGGTERFLVQLLEHGDRSAFRSDVCVISDPGVLAPSYARSARFVWHLGVRSGRGWIRGLARWRRALQQSQPELLVLYGSRANLLGRMFGRRIPVVSAVRSVYIDEQARKAVAWLDRATRSRVTAFVTNTRSAFPSIDDQSRREPRVIYVPPAAALGPLPSRQAARHHFGVAEDDVVALCVGSLKPVKNHEMLLRASVRAVAAGWRHRLWLVGDGPLRGSLEQLVSDLKADHVTLAGREEDVRRRYAAADVCVLASRWEGTPTTLLEAVSTGVPFVATSVGDVPLLFTDDECGRLVSPDDEDAFTAALQQAITDRQRRSRWHEAALRKAQGWSVDQMIRSYEDAFRAAMGVAAP